MCGIAGYSGNFNPDLLPLMATSMAHRGPDGHDQWNDLESGIGLAHRRLAIIDLTDNGRQPMTNGNNTLHLVYNGEIYNYRQLRQSLISRGHIFKSDTDSEVILHLYEEEGTQLLKRIKGIYAFAIWDSNNRSLFLARDGIGVKPLYYSLTNSGFIFASELKALLYSKEVSKTLDISGIHQTLTYLWTPAPKTVLKHIKKLRPGYAIQVSNGKIIREWQHFDPQYSGKYSSSSERDLIRELQERLYKAVEQQMVSDVPIGAFLSGGLDSSSIVAMMQKVEPEAFTRCYTIGLPPEFGDSENAQDLPHAIEVADHLNLDLKTLIVQPDIIDHLGKMLYHLDEPQADPAPINTLLIAEQARRDGYKVLLSGAGGDDLFSGYRRHWALKLEQLWGWLPQFARRGIRWTSNENPFIKLPRRIRKAMAYADLPTEDRLISYFFWTSTQLSQNLYSRDFAYLLGDEDPSEPLRESLRNIPKEKDSINQMLYLETKHFLADHNLNYTDKMGMAAGVEIRVPILDQDLVDFAATLPPSLKQKWHTSKYILRKAMKDYLPKNVISRPKTGFGAPIRRWINHELRDSVDDLLSVQSLSNRGIFDPIKVRGLVEQTRHNGLDAGYTILSLMCIEQWCRIFVDAPHISVRL